MLADRRASRLGARCDKNFLRLDATVAILPKSTSSVLAVIFVDILLPLYSLYWSTMPHDDFSLAEERSTDKAIDERCPRYHFQSKVF